MNTLAERQDIIFVEKYGQTYEIKSSCPTMGSRDAGQWTCPSSKLSDCWQLQLLLTDRAVFLLLGKGQGAVRIQKEAIYIFLIICSNLEIK